MSLAETEWRLSWRRAREAAAAVRRAEHGRRALRTVRPRGVLGLVRSRGPLAVILYVAAREGRLVWQHEDGFALLEPPLAGREWRRPPGVSSWALRLVDRHWDLLVLAVPPSFVLLVMLSLVPFPAVRIGALLLAPLPVGYIAVLLTALVVQVVRWIMQAFAGGRDTGGLSADELTGYQWWMPLCHQRIPARMAGLLDQIEHHLRALIRTRVMADASHLGGRVRAVEVIETIVCLLEGAATACAEEAIKTATARTRFAGTDAKVAFMALARDEPGTDRGPGGTGGFLLYAAAIVITVPALALIISGQERDACAPDCAGRPASFGTALHWLSERLLLHDPPGVSPGTTQGVVLGWLTSGMALMLVPVAMVAFGQLKQRQRDKWQVYREARQAVRQHTKVLIMVVTPEEREAVFTAVREVNGEHPASIHLAEDTIFDLGTVSNARVLLAQSEQGMLSPGAATLTAQAVIQEVDPDYVILTGICYGLKDDQRIADVLVATQVRVLDHKKIVEAAEAGAPPIELPRGSRPDPSQRLRSCARAATYNWPQRDVHDVHFGPMLTLNTLVDSPTYRARLIAADRDAIGGEMESGGVYAAAARARVDWLMVKSIADRGMDKDDHAHRTASASAASFVVHMISERGLDQPVT